ncbi:MAG: hypothetical protein IPL61_08145 [Myxococcales bacterium]|nr:hypothetical protein [Myxococcales bacterium]
MLHLRARACSRRPGPSTRPGPRSRACAPGAVPVACELSEPASVRACVEAVRRDGGALAGIIANAGIMALPTLTVRHGLERQFLTNHLVATSC